ncbi:MAG: rod shape-determining protein MreC [Candidatus Aureabacteria bacterium]|nr:rod shape-determining protein MreC [Candidatus Auribacterota bacterium]
MVSRNVIWVAVAGAIIVLSLSLPYQVSSRSRVVIIRAFSPFINLEHSLISGARLFGVRWNSRGRLKEENIALRWKAKELSREVAELRDLKNENRRLRRLLDFKESSSHRLLPAQVVGRDARHWYSGVVIDRGTRDGVRPDMAVIDDEGVVGKVVESAPEMSTVLLIVDKRSRIGSVVERTRENGVLEGTSFNTCRLSYLPRRAEIRAGDRVLTSGMGGIYPKGLYVGECIGVYEGEYGLYTCADISPGVNFSTLEEVLVLIDHAVEKGDLLR